MRNWKGWGGIGAAALVVLAVSGGCLGPRARESRFEAAGSFHQVALGIGEDYPKSSRSMAAARRDLEVLRAHDIHLLRISFAWAEMEPEPGKIDWSFWDDFVPLATQVYGIRLAPYICYTPRWAAENAGPDFWRQPPKDNQRFADFIRQLVGRYRKYIHSWEIWNEPDNPEYWLGSKEQFARLLAAGSRAAREADAGTTVVMGGLAWNLNLLDFVLSEASCASNLDVINLHNYYETWSGDPLERLSDYVGRARDIIATHRQHEALWMAEVGYSNFRRGAYVSPQVRATYRYEHTPEHQAAALFEVMTLLLASGKVSLATWYRIHDLPETQDVIGDVNNRYLGVLDSRGQAKPALAALTYFHQLFAEGFRGMDDRVRLSKFISVPAEVHAFLRSDGRTVCVAWLRTVIPGELKPELNGKALDRRSEAISLDLPEADARSANLFNELGRYEGICKITHRHGQSHTNLALTPGGVTVLILSPFTVVPAGIPHREEAMVR